MIEGERRDGIDGRRVFRKRENIDAILLFFDETTDGDAAAVRGGDGHGVDRVRGLECDNIIGAGMRFLSRIIH